MMLAIGVLAVPRGAAAASPPPAAPVTAARYVDVVQVGGVLDPVNLDLIRSGVDQAVRGGTEVLVIQLDSGFAAASPAQVTRIVDGFAASTVPIAVWVGPGRGSRAVGAAHRLVDAADVKGAAPGAVVGPLAARTEVTVRQEDPAAAAVDLTALTLTNFIGLLDGREAKGRTIHTLGERTASGQQGLDVIARFRRPGLLGRTLHALGDPSAAYFLLVAGALLLLFEFFSAGVGVAAGCGVACLAASAYGLGALPTRPLGLGLLLVAVVAFAVDIQTGTPRFWTGVGSIALVIGSLTIYDGTRPSWLALLLVIVGALLFCLYGIPATVRARFSTPTIGREDMVGATGVALTSVDPDGTVEVRGAPWRARTFPTKIQPGDRIEVIAIEGLLLEVVPEGTELQPLRSVERAEAKARAASAERIRGTRIEEVD